MFDAKTRVNAKQIAKIMAKSDKKYLLVAQEIKLAKILAGNNKKLRERTLKRLRKWLCDRTAAARK